MSPVGRIKQPVPCVQLPQATPMPGTATGAPALTQNPPVSGPVAAVRQQNSAQPLSASAPMAGVKLAGGVLKQAQSMQMGNVHRAGGELGMALSSLCASCTDSADLTDIPGLNLGGQANSMGSDLSAGGTVFDKSGGVGGVGSQQARRFAPASFPLPSLYTPVHLYIHLPSLPSWQPLGPSSPPGWSSAPTAVSRRRRCTAPRIAQ